MILTDLPELFRLPVELFECIIDFSLPENWYESGELWVLNLRLVNSERFSFAVPFCPLQAAKSQGFSEIFEKRVLGRAFRKIDCNAKNAKGVTPLSWAARNGRDEVTELLLKCANIDIEIKGAFDTTALTWAIESAIEKEQVNQHVDDNQQLLRYERIHVRDMTNC